MTTKYRGRQVRPTQAEINSAWVRLRSAADSGDQQANALLVALAKNKPIIQMPAW